MGTAAVTQADDLLSLQEVQFLWYNSAAIVAGAEAAVGVQPKRKHLKRNKHLYSDIDEVFWDFWSVLYPFSFSLCCSGRFCLFFFPSYISVQIGAPDWLRTSSSGLNTATSSVAEL